jgi:hypothetical protein
MLLDTYWNILTMHVLINVKSSNNIRQWQMGFNSAFKGLIQHMVSSLSVSDRPVHRLRNTFLSQPVHRTVTY